LNLLEIVGRSVVSFPMLVPVLVQQRLLLEFDGLDCGFSHFLHLLLDVGDFDTEVFQVQNLRFAMRSTITSVAIAVWLVATCRCAFMTPTVAVAAYRIT